MADFKLTTGDSLDIIRDEIVSCRLCPRLVAWREKVAEEKVRRFKEDDYWGKALPGFGDPQAGLILVGLAPAAHGGNRTGRMFTGDNSGKWLYGALYRFGFSNRAESIRRDDDLRLKDAYITAAVRCAPPDNKPEKPEFERCAPFLKRELKLLKNKRILLGHGKIGFDKAIDSLEFEKPPGYRRPKFSHGAQFQLSSNLFLLGSFHPSQQNTYTGRLTEEMFHSVFRRARAILDGKE